MQHVGFFIQNYKKKCRQVFPFARLKKTQHTYTVLKSFSRLETFYNTSNTSLTNPQRYVGVGIRVTWLEKNLKISSDMGGEETIRYSRVSNQTT